MTSEAAYRKPLPEIDAVSEEFWKAALEHRFLLYTCGNCGTAYYPAQDCGVCDDLEPPMSWRKASGEGELYSWIVMHRAYHDGFKDELPYNVALIKLKEGPYFLTNIVGCEPEDLKLGTPVVVDFEDVTKDVSLPKFRPAPR